MHQLLLSRPPSKSRLVCDLRGFPLSDIIINNFTGAPLEDKLQNENVQTHNIASGDFVRVELDPEVFRAMHEEEYGWSNLMLAVSACVVTCLRCTNTRCILDLPTFLSKRLCITLKRLIASEL